MSQDLIKKTKRRNKLLVPLGMMKYNNSQRKRKKKTKKKDSK
jgi:hypothetical protein